MQTQRFAQNDKRICRDKQVEVKSEHANNVQDIADIGAKHGHTITNDQEQPNTDEIQALIAHAIEDSPIRYIYIYTFMQDIPEKLHFET